LHVSKKADILLLYIPRLYAFLSKIKDFSFLSQMSDNNENNVAVGIFDLNI